MPEEARPLWYLDGATVTRHLPGSEHAQVLAAFVLETVGRNDGDRQAKVSLPPSALGTFAQAMAARVDALDSPDGRAVLGMKWIAGNPGNRSRGLPAMASVVVLDDPASGLPMAILDGSPITAARTAALSGAAIRILTRAGAPPTSALILGAGVQGHAHVGMLGACGISTIRVHDRHPERARALAAAPAHPGLDIEAVDDPRPWIGKADVVISATSLASGVPWIGIADVSPDAIIIPVDYAAQVSGGLVAGAGTFLIDDHHAWRDNRDRGRLPDWPEPADTLGGRAVAAAGGAWTRPPGVAVALHQGPGLADVMFADAVLGAALAAGDALQLSRG